MTRIADLYEMARDKKRFADLNAYIDFARRFIDFVVEPVNVSAVITSVNEHCYKFIQYKEDAGYHITRPINADLFMTQGEKLTELTAFLARGRGIAELAADDRVLLNKIVYTLQQSVGCALDALPAGAANAARKVNGDLFERLMLLVFRALKFDVGSVVERVRDIPGATLTYQHDLAFKVRGVLRLVGSVKTSSKDRIDKVFMDKLFYNRIRRVDIPHFAVFLNDVQRKKTKDERRGFGVSQTFMQGHFKAYSLAMTPLDGVYYCDLRPVMQTDPFLKREIKRLDQLICEDIWQLIEAKAR